MTRPTPAHRTIIADSIAREDQARPQDGPMVFSTSGATWTDRWNVAINYRTAAALVRQGLLEVIAEGDWDTPTSYRITPAGRTL